MKVADIWPKVQRTGQCFHCHSALSTSFLTLPGPFWQNAFTHDIQKGIQFRETWEVVRLVLFVFLLLEAMPCCHL